MHPALAGVRLVVFDAVGTLIHPTPPVADVYRAAGERYGVSLPHEDVRRRFSAAFAAAEAADADRGWVTDEPRERERWRGVVAAVFAEASVAVRESLFAELHALYATPAVWRVRPADVATLDRLTAAGLRLGVGSNFDGRLHAVLDATPLGPRLPLRIVSSEVGHRKPAPAFFAAVCDRAGLPPHEIAFVGDDRVNDFEGATRFGMRAVLIGPDEPLAGLG